MSKIETHEVCTNLDENHRAPRINPSAHDWETTPVHDKNRGTVIAFAKLIENSLFESIPNFLYSDWLAKRRRKPLTSNLPNIF